MAQMMPVLIRFWVTEINVNEVSIKSGTSAGTAEKQ